MEAKLLSEKSDDGLCTQLENILNLIKYEAARHGFDHTEIEYYHEDGAEDGELITSLKELGYEVEWMLQPPCILISWHTPTEDIPEDIPEEIPEAIQNVIMTIDAECALAKMDGIARPEKHWGWAEFYATSLDLNTDIKPDRDDVSTWAELVQKRKFLHLNNGSKHNG